MITSALVECSFQPFALPIGPGNSAFPKKSNEPRKKGPWLVGLFRG